MNKSEIIEYWKRLIPYSIILDRETIIKRFISQIEDTIKKEEEYNIDELCENAKLHWRRYGLVPKKIREKIFK